MNAETRSYPPAGIRASDAERDLAVAELSEHFQSGRLTQDEFDDRSARALQARTGADLSGLFTDLPGQAAVPVPPHADLLTDPFAGYGSQRPPGGLLAGRAILAFIIIAIIAGGVFNRHGHAHGADWFIPVVILSLVFLRLTRLARRRRWLPADSPGR
jgi:hypothetical protein